MAFEYVFDAPWRRQWLVPYVKCYAHRTPDAPVRMIVFETGGIVRLKRPREWRDASPGDEIGMAYVLGLSLEEAAKRLPRFLGSDNVWTTAREDFLRAPVTGNAVRLAVLELFKGDVRAALYSTGFDRTGRAV